MLRDVSLRAEPGTTTAMVGSTGSGKTTLLSLVPRLFDATAGTVLVDGVDVTTIEPETLYGRIGLVPQRAYLFTGTIATNLRYGKPDATDEELWDALRTAQAEDFVAALAEGLHAPVAQGGTNFSGGQRQRLAIARAVVRRPEIYLFDDAFSALDLATDARLRAALRPITRDCDRHRRGAAGVHDRRRGPDRGARGRRRGRARDARRARAHAARRTPRSWSPSCPRRWRHERRTDEPPPPPANPHRPPPGRGPAPGRCRPACRPRSRWTSGRPHAAAGPAGARSGCWSSSSSLLAVAGVAFARASGRRSSATRRTIIFEGVIGKQLPAGITQQQAIDAARARGDDGFANLLSGMTVVPGQGVDFTQLAHVLLVVLVLYVVSAVCTFGQARLLAGVVARTVLRLRADVEDKLHRLPLSYFDTRPRGELLSRVTNDIDNVQQTMQQTHEPAAQLAADAGRRAHDDGARSPRSCRSSRWSPCRCRCW